MARLNASIGAAVLVLFLAPAGSAEAGNLKGDLEAAVHLKALRYDRALRNRTNGALRIAVLSAPGNSSSQRVQREMVRSFRRVGSRMKGIKVSAIPVDYSRHGLFTSLIGMNANVIYVGPNLAGELSTIYQTARKLNAPTLCGSKSMGKRGVAISVFRDGSSPGLAINIQIARRLGMDIDPRLFRVAEVLR